MSARGIHQPDVHDAQFERELQRRLDLIEDPAYEDPARRDLPAGDILGLVGLVVAVVIVAYLLLY